MSSISFAQRSLRVRNKDSKKWLDSYRWSAGNGCSLFRDALRLGWGSRQRTGFCLEQVPNQIWTQVPNRSNSYRQPRNMFFFSGHWFFSWINFLRRWKSGWHSEEGYRWPIILHLFLCMISSGQKSVFISLDSHPTANGKALAGYLGARSQRSLARCSIWQHPLGGNSWTVWWVGGRCRTAEMWLAATTLRKDQWLDVTSILYQVTWKWRFDRWVSISLSGFQVLCSFFGA